MILWSQCYRADAIFSKDMDKSIVSPFLTHGVFKTSSSTVDGYISIKTAL